MSTRTQDFRSEWFDFGYQIEPGILNALRKFRNSHPFTSESFKHKARCFEELHAGICAALAKELPIDRLKIAICACRHPSVLSYLFWLWEEMGHTRDECRRFVINTFGRVWPKAFAASLVLRGGEIIGGDMMAEDCERLEVTRYLY